MVRWVVVVVLVFLALDPTLCSVQSVWASNSSAGLSSEDKSRFTERIVEFLRERVEEVVQDAAGGQELDEDQAFAKLMTPTIQQWMGPERFEALRALQINTTRSETLKSVSEKLSKDWLMSLVQRREEVSPSSHLVPSSATTGNQGSTGNFIMTAPASDCGTCGSGFCKWTNVVRIAMRWILVGLQLMSFLQGYLLDRYKCFEPSDLGQLLFTTIADVTDVGLDFIGPVDPSGSVHALGIFVTSVASLLVARNIRASSKETDYTRTQNSVQVGDKIWLRYDDKSSDDTEDERQDDQLGDPIRELRVLGFQTVENKDCMNYYPAVVKAAPTFYQTHHLCDDSSGKRVIGTKGFYEVVWSRTKRDLTHGDRTRDLLLRTGCGIGGVGGVMFPPSSPFVDDLVKEAPSIGEDNQQLALQKKHPYLFPAELALMSASSVCPFGTPAVEDFPKDRDESIMCEKSLVPACGFVHRKRLHKKWPVLRVGDQVEVTQSHVTQLEYEQEGVLETKEVNLGQGKSQEIGVGKGKSYRIHYRGTVTSLLSHEHDHAYKVRFKGVLGESKKTLDFYGDVPIFKLSHAEPVHYYKGIFIAGLVFVLFAIVTVSLVVVVNVTSVRWMHIPYLSLYGAILGLAMPHIFKTRSWACQQSSMENPWSRYALTVLTKRYRTLFISTIVYFSVGLAFSAAHADFTGGVS